MASAKGAEAGVVCRNCGAIQEERMGKGWTLAEAADSLFCLECGDTHHFCPKSPLHGKGLGE